MRKCASQINVVTHRYVAEKVIRLLKIDYGGANDMPSGYGNALLGKMAGALECIVRERK